MQNFCEVAFIFFIYAFIGWILEIIYTYFTDGKIINRGFLVGPVIPIYGVGSLIITFGLSKYKNDLLAVFLLSIVLLSLLEYITSYLMEKIFKNRWWDYSYMKYNINGRICLETIIPFGLGAVIITKFTNPLIFKLINYIPNNIKIYISIILTIILLIDIIVSFKVIITLKNISSSIKCDSTEIITKKVKEILFTKNKLFARLFESFPDMKAFNKMAILKSKLDKDKENLKEEKKKNKKRTIFK